MLLLLHANKYVDHEKEKLILIIILVIGLLQHSEKVLVNFNKIANICSKCVERG